MPTCMEGFPQSMLSVLNNMLHELTRTTICSTWLLKQL